MKQNLRILIFIVALLALMLACANPLGGEAPETTLNVETVVAATFEALTQVAPPPPSSLLPASIYFLANDSIGRLQVFRLERDGATVTQLTFEPVEVKEFEVSLVDGSVAYISNNQIITVNADGSDRAMIFDGGAMDEINPFLTSIRGLAWSPDGLTIAFGYKGLNLYSIIEGVSNRVLDDVTREMDGGFVFPEELYVPEIYSADGSKLILTLAYYEGASTAIYHPASGGLVRLSGGEGTIICCGDYHLTPDASALFSASPFMGMSRAGLWRVDVASGDVTALLQSDFDSNPLDAADNPFLAPDGQLYYFYAAVPNMDGFMTRAQLQLVRSAADGVSGRTVLRPETFERMTEALWAPDASFVIVANAQDEQTYQGGAAQLYYTDGRPMIPLLPFSFSMQWGP
jgi:hypothetical protein